MKNSPWRSSRLEARIFCAFRMGWMCYGRHMEDPRFIWTADVNGIFARAAKKAVG